MRMEKRRRGKNLGSLKECSVHRHRNTEEKMGRWERGNLCPDPVRECRERRRGREGEREGRERRERRELLKIYVNFSFTVRGVNRVC